MFCLGFHGLAHQALCFALEFDEPLVEGSQVHLCGLSSIPQRHSRDELRISCRHLQKIALFMNSRVTVRPRMSAGHPRAWLKGSVSTFPNHLFERATRSRKSTADSAITGHMREHPEYFNTDPKSRLKVLASARDFWHLEVLEALFIKARNPSLCAQKEHGRVLKLF